MMGVFHQFPWKCRGERQSPLWIGGRGGGRTNDLQRRVVILAMAFKRGVGGRGDFWAERIACVKAGRCPTHSVA